MITVRLTGWRGGLRKIDLTRLMQSSAKLSLKEAKACVDSVLDDKPVTLRFASLIEVEAFVRAAEELGAICEVDPEESSTPPGG